MLPLIISAPFGSYLQPICATPTLGTYTLARRAGFCKRWWRVLSTVRYNRRTQAWVNRLGLPSPGIESLRTMRPWRILSIHGFGADDWRLLGEHAARLQAHALELNLSCPNVTATALKEAVAAVQAVRRSYSGRLVAKLSPIRPLEWATALHQDARVREFHLCNTLPTPGGGLSGKPLKPLSLWAVADVRQRFGDRVVIIGGGGVTGTADVTDYLSAGADHVALGSWLLNPLNWRKLPALAAYLDEARRVSTAAAGVVS